MARFAGLSVDNDKVQHSVENSSLQTLQRIEEEKGYPGIKSPGFKFFRKGVTGDWRNHFGPAEKAFFKRYANPVLLRLGYIDTPDW